MRILHTADWHLGRIFHGVHLTEDQAQVLAQFLDLARDLRPDLVVVAGDIFDRPVPPAEAVALLDEVLSRLVVDLKLKVILFPGNHDSPERLRFGRRLFEKQGLFVVTSPRGEHLVFEDSHGRVHFLVLPYISAPHLSLLFSAEEASLEELWSRLLPSPPGKRTLLCTHAFVQGGVESPSEMLLVGGAELLPASLFEAYTFCLLGHLHRRQTIGGNIHYAGALMSYSFREAGEEKGVSLLEVDHQGGVKIETYTLTPPRGLVVLEGSFQELLAGPARQDFVKIILTDKEPVFEAFRRLKKVYPHLVVLEQPYFQGLKGASLRQEVIRREEDLLFRGFMKEITGNLPSPEEEALFREVVGWVRDKET